MDPKVYQAALEGAWEKLDSLGSWRDQLTPARNTVLHVHVGRAVREDKVNIEFIKNVVDGEGMALSLLWHENDNGEIPLHLAAAFGHAEAAKEFLGRVRAVDEGEVRRMLMKTNVNKDTALHHAARFGHERVVKLLVEADPNAHYEANDAEETPLYLAAESESTHCLATIIDHCASNGLEYHHIKGPRGRTALHVTVQWTTTEMTRKILDKDESFIVLKDDNESTPVHCAAAEKESKNLQILLSYEKKTSESAAYMTDNKGRTPLHIATLLRNWDGIKVLMFYRPDCIEILDNEGKNVLHYAADWACIKKFKDFLNLGHDFGKLMDQKDKQGNTPFHLIAANMYRMNCICFVNTKFMKSYKKHAKLFNKENLTAVDIVASQDYPTGGGTRFIKMLHRDGLIAAKGESDKDARATTKYLPQPVGVCSRNLEVLDGNELIAIKGKSDEDVGATIKGSSRSPDSDVVQNRIVVAALIATVSFTAGFTIPGGFNQDSDDPCFGTAVLSEKAAFQAFLVFDMLALTLSFMALFLYLLISGPGIGIFTAMQSKMQLYNADLFNQASMGAMMLAFVSGVYAVIPQSPFLQAMIFSLGTLFLGFYGLVFGGQVIDAMGKQLHFDTHKILGSPPTSYHLYAWRKLWSFT